MTKSLQSGRFVAQGVMSVAAMQGEVIIGWSSFVVMGATRKSFYHEKWFYRSMFLGLLPPNIFHGGHFYLPQQMTSHEVGGANG